MRQALILLALVFAFPAHADVPLGPSPTTVLGQGWEAWKSQIPSWTDYMPGMVVFRNLGRMESNATIGFQKLKNLRAYDRYCGSGAPFHQQPFCRAADPTAMRKNGTDLLTHAPLWILLDSLAARAGPANTASVDAAKLLATIRTQLEYPEDKPTSPDLLIGRLYAQFANCVPTACQVAVTRPDGFFTAMKGLAAYFTTYGGETDLQAVKLLHQAGF